MRRIDACLNAITENSQTFVGVKEITLELSFHQQPAMIIFMVKIIQECGVVATSFAFFTQYSMNKINHIYIFWLST